MAKPFLREDQFERLYSVLQQEPKIHTRDRERERRFLEAVYWMDRSGAQWRLLPAEYGGWNSVYERFARWADLVLPTVLVLWGATRRYAPPTVGVVRDSAEQGRRGGMLN